MQVLSGAWATLTAVDQEQERSVRICQDLGRRSFYSIIRTSGNHRVQETTNTIPVTPAQPTAVVTHALDTVPVRSVQCGLVSLKCRACVVLGNLATKAVKFSTACCAECHNNQSKSTRCSGRCHCVVTKKGLVTKKDVAAYELNQGNPHGPP
jgi:hypothetical protein